MASHAGKASAEPWLRQLAWREFACQLRYHHPQSAGDPMRSKFSRFPQRSDRKAIRKWQRGQAGYPIVDAGMRQLWHSGWMHNRVRMVAGCGTDAAPYFRVFNPVRQGERFDGQGTYVRRWVPELRRVGARWVHQPFQAPSLLLTGDSEGNGYPEPMVDHHFTRQRALDVLGSLNA